MPTPTHKSATSVTLAPLAEKSAFEGFVQRYWIFGVAVALAISGWVIFSYQSSQATKRARDESWDKFNGRTTLAGFPRVPSADAAVLEALATELKGTQVGPWSRLMEANALIEKRDYAAAKTALERLRADYPAHPLVVDRWQFSETGAPESLLEHWLGALAERESWELQHTQLFTNPAADPSAARITLATERGDIVVALFPSRAPLHCEQFLSLVDSSYFNGTKFHRIDPQMGVDGGDPNTRTGEVGEWGQGGKDKLVPSEASGLFHFAGALSAMEADEAGQSVLGRFSILSEDRHDLDGQRVVFGVVESGLEIVRQIAAAGIVADSDGRPEQPVALVSAARR